MGSGVFVSYRKGDDPGWAGRVRDSLANHFGDENVFFDVDSIRGGQRWEEAIDASLLESGTVVLVIGPRWLECLKEREASTDTDYHLREITMALDRGINVYPVRVHSAPMPDLADLPEELRTRLPAIQWMEIYDNLFGPSMERVILDIERVMDPDGTGPGGKRGRAKPGSAAPEVVLRAEVTVGPWGTDADFHEIADAVAVTAPGGTVRVRAGRYLKQVVIDRPIAIVGEGKGEALLDNESVPCLLSTADGGVVRRLRITSTAPAGAECIRIESGDLALEDVRVSARWVPSSTGIVARGGARATIGGAVIESVAVGMRIEDGSVPRIERTTIAEATEHAVVITTRADPQISSSTFAGAGQATVLVSDHGLGTIDDCAIGTGGGPEIEIRTGGSPTIRGGRGNPLSSAASSLVNLPERVVRSRVPGGGANDEDRSDWHVVVADGGLGTVVLADLAEVRTTGGGAPTLADCKVTVVRGEEQGLGTYEHCEIGQVVLVSGADPTFRSQCTIAPERGVKITVDVSGGAKGTFEDCEIVGRNVRDGSPDPAVLSSGGAPTLRRCNIKNPGEGAVSVSAGGDVTLEGGDVRSSVSGPAVVVDDGSAEVSGAALHGGVRVGGSGSLRMSTSQVDADPVAGGVLEVQADGTVHAEICELKGPGFAAARKVGRWIESKGEKVRGKTTSVIGASKAVRLAEGSTASFSGCTFIGVGEDGMVVPASGATFDDCTSDGSPYP